MQICYHHKFTAPALSICAQYNRVTGTSVALMLAAQCAAGVYLCSILFFYVRMNTSCMRRRGAERQKDEGERDKNRRDKTITSPLQNRRFKTNYFSKQSFHHCMAAGAALQ